MIKVYDSTERLFNHNGIKILHPSSAEITKTDNGDYYAELKDTIDNLEYYQKGMIVRIPTPWGVQGFRFDNPKVKNNKVEAKAWHLTYDAKNYVIKDAYAVDKNCNDALEHFNSSTDNESPLSTISDIATVLSTRIVRKSLFEVYEALISSDKYGGHWERDNWTFGIKNTIGQDRGVVLSVGKNITDIEISENWDAVCTKILPHTVVNEKTILLDDTYLSIGEDLYDIPYTKVISFENNFDIANYETEEALVAEAKEWLKSQAEQYLADNKLPKVNYSVSANINNISDVGDKIQVKHPKCKVNILTEVISIVYDAIRNKYIKIEFGNFKSELKNLSQNIIAEANKHSETLVKESQTLLQSELEKATSTINGVLGNSYVIYEGDKILVVDKLPKEEADNILVISNGGIGFKKGTNGVLTSAWTMDNTLNMENINVMNFTASLIKGGVLKLGGLDNSSGTFELYDSQNTLIALMDKDGLTVTNPDTKDYVRLNAKEGFVGYNSKGEKIYWADGSTFHMKNAEIENEIKIASKIKVVPVSTSENVGVGFVAIG